MQTIQVSPEQLFAGSISPLIYGDFIEFLNDLIPGMRAERVQDKCFAGILQPRYVYPPGQNWAYPRWRTFVAGQSCFPSGAEAYFDPPHVAVRFELDREQPFVGEQSARVAIEPAVAARPFVAGLLQEGIPVRSEEALSLELYARGQGPLQVLLGRNHGVFFHTYAQLEFKGLTEQWRRFSGQLTPDTTDENASLAIGASGRGAFWLGKVSLIAEDNELGWRRDVVQAVRQMRPGVIRFGGSSLIYYQWEQGIGPSAQRAPFVNHPWGNMEENDVGLFEFLQFCELVQAEPLICVNSNSTTVQQVLNEVEFCNGAANSPYGSIRAEMGRPEPFRVKYWQIGNEQSGEAYERTLHEYAVALRRRYPDLVLLASYPSDNIIQHLSSEIDYICPHFYDPYSQAGEQELRALCQTIRESARNPKLKLGITEWNHTAGHWGWGRAWLQTLYNALNAARMLNMYQRLGDMTRIACRSNMTNSCYSGTIQTTRSDSYFTPCYHVMKAYANLAGDQALRVEAHADEMLDIAATRRQKDGQVALFVVNDRNQAQSRRVVLEDCRTAAQRVQVWTLSGPSLDAVNSFQEKERVRPQESEIDSQGGALEYEFPAYSLTVLRFG